MTQNIYDDAKFFGGYSQLPRSVAGLDAAPEWPSLKAMLPEMAGLRVVDLGCGFGWFSRWAREAGSAGVLGLDVSQNMIAGARERTDDAAVRYDIADLERLDLPAGAFDLAYSSLAFHYIADLTGLSRAIFRALAPGGRLVFSIEHPIYVAPRHPGFVQGPAGTPVWPLDQYSEEGPRVTDWLAPGVVKQHRTMGTLLNTLIAAGFTLRHIEEWRPDDALLAARPDYAEYRERPIFLLIAAET